MKSIYLNGKVYSGTLPLCEAFAVENGKFIFCGSNEEARALAAEGDTLTDLNGSFVCAGFNDSHMHLFSYGTALNSALLAEHTDSLAGMLKYLREYAEENGAEGSWIIGRGWNQDYFSDVSRLPSRWDLDTVSADRPILITRACGHCLVINSKAMEAIGLSACTPCPEGGCIGMENGVPDGRLYDNAMELAYSMIPLPGKEEIKACILKACSALNSYGVTSSQTDDYCVQRALPWALINEAYRELEAEGKLTVRVYEQSNFTDTASFAEFMDSGCVTGAGSDMFKIGPLKMLGDGALGARTAYLSVPYADDSNAVGIPVFSQELMDAMVELAVSRGMQVAVHAIGDACLDIVLSAYEKAFAKYKPQDHRCGIVHCQITRPDQLRKIEELGLHIYAQSIFLDYDIHIIEARVGAELAASSYCWKTLMKNGVRVSNGTDCPVELPDAMAGIQCAVTRSTLSGLGPYLPDEAFTVAEALDSYTSAGAYSSFDEDRKGRIAPGMLADFVILAASPFETAADKLREIPVLATYLGGECVFRR